MTVSDFLAITFKSNDDYYTRDKVICVDGFSVSIQGNAGAYSEPRENSKYYSSVELGFPNQEDELIKDYAENKKNLTGTVYGWVPIEVVDKLIKKHKGIDLKKTFKY